MRRLGFAIWPEIEEAALRMLCRYHWPGNVRELETMLERLAAHVGDGGVLTLAQVQPEISLNQKDESGDIEYVTVLRAGESLNEHLSGNIWRYTKSCVTASAGTIRVQLAGWGLSAPPFTTDWNEHGSRSPRMAPLARATS